VRAHTTARDRNPGAEVGRTRETALVRGLLTASAMRWFSSIVLVLTACGTDVRTMPPGDDPNDPTVDGGVTPSPDGGGTVIPPSDGGVDPDSIPPDLTPCEAAVYHSSLAWIQAEIFDVSCTDKCHSGAFPGAGMNLTPGFAHAHLVGVASSTHAGWTRVVPGNPGASMLMVQIGGEPGPELEGLMPWNQPKLCDEMIDAVRRWIQQGAPP
jgi:hypothetical protein